MNKQLSSVFTHQSDPKHTSATADHILCLALDIGEGMLKSGDNVHHVEDTVTRICRAYGGVHVEVFAIHSLILASLRMGDGSYSSQIRRVLKSANNMMVFEHFNTLSRRICKETPDFEVAQTWLREIKAKKTYPLWRSLLGSALVSCSFAILFGGGLFDGIAGALVGLILSLISRIKTASVNALARTLILSFVAGVASYLTVIVGLGQNVDMIMIGSIMLLIPGLAFGNALRDLLCGEILTGVLNTVQSCLSAVLIACGFSGAMLLMSGFGVAPGGPAIEHAFFISLAVAILGTVAFAMEFRVRASYFWLTAIGGGAVYAVYSLFAYFGAPMFVCALCCSAFGAAYSEVCARLFKVPAMVFLSSIIISIVPGGSLYYTMSALVDGNAHLLMEKAGQTLYISTGLVAGSILVTMIVSIIQERRRGRN